jgi:hypothetical protein
MDEVSFDERWDGAAIPISDWHFHQRLYERYKGLWLYPGEYTQLTKSIKKRRYVIVGHRDNALDIKVILKRAMPGAAEKQILIRVLVQRDSMRMRTALPLEADQSIRRLQKQII